MDTQKSVVVYARQPQATLSETPGTNPTRFLFFFEIVLLFAAAIILNIVLEADIYMWMMIIFGAAVITALLSAAGAHLFSSDKH